MNTKIFSFSFLLLLVFSFQSEEEIIFTVSEIDQLTQECSIPDKKYYFSILGSLEGECNPSEDFSIDFSDKKEGASCHLTCDPLDSENQAYLSCFIDILSYPLEKKTVSIDKAVPQVEGLKFDNWEEFMSSEGNNTIGNEITCKPEISEELSFVVNSMNFNGGCILKNVSITISANLTDGSMGVNDTYFNMDLSEPKNKQVYCHAHQNDALYYLYCNGDVSNKLISIGKYEGYDIDKKIKIKVDGNGIRKTAIDCNKSYGLMMNSLLLFAFIALLL